LALYRQALALVLKSLTTMNVPAIEGDLMGIDMAAL